MYTANDYSGIAVTRLIDEGIDAFHQNSPNEKLVRNGQIVFSSARVAISFQNIKQFVDFIKKDYKDKTIGVYTVNTTYDDYFIRFGIAE